MDLYGRKQVIVPVRLCKNGILKFRARSSRYIIITTGSDKTSPPIERKTMQIQPKGMYAHVTIEPTSSD